MSDGETRAAGPDVPGVTPLAIAAAEEAVPTAPSPDDEPWSNRFGAINAADHPTVVAVRGDEVYIGGDFITHMAGMPDLTYLRVAHWDGASWRRMGGGVDAAVHALAVVGDDVYVGGYLTAADSTVEASRLARWDGARWSPVAGGVSCSQPGIEACVRALASDGEKLYVAGTFDAVGSGEAAVPASGFAALDLRTGVWESYGAGLRFGDGLGEGYALAIAGGRVYVGGSFDRAGTANATSLAALDRRTGRWKRFGAGVRTDDLAGRVESLAVDPATGTIYVGGSFTTAGRVEAAGLATLAGARFGSLGRFTYYGDTRGVRIAALAHSGGRLYAAGTFTTVDDAEVSHWAVHDGQGWTSPAEMSNSVVALAAFGEGVVVTGMFTQADGLWMPHAGIWTGMGWQTFGQGLTFDPYADGYVNALAATGSGVYAGGYFDQAGPVRAGSVAEWREGAWHDMAGGLASPWSLATVRAMLPVGSDLYVTGAFTSAGGVAASNIARWDGERWSPLAGGISGTGNALVMLGGRLYVGGHFHAADGVPAYNLASWDPAAQTWSAVGSVPVYDGAILSLAALHDRHLVVGGAFSRLWMGRFQVSGLNSLVMFDTHSPREPDNPFAGYSRVPGVTSSWIPGAVRAMHLLGDALYVGGTFDRAGVRTWDDPPSDGFDAANLAAWRYDDGIEAWSTPGGTLGPVTAFTTLEGHSLVAGGWFSGAGSIAASSVGEHDPATGEWKAYGSGIGWGLRGGPEVHALAQSPADGLWVGGRFTVAGGAPSCSIALWRGTAGRAP